MTKSSGGTKAEHVTVDANRSNGTTDTLAGTVRDLVARRSIDLTPASSRQSSAPGNRPSSAALAFQQASQTYNEALLDRRVQLVQQIQAALSDTGTIAHQSIAAYSTFLDGMETLCTRCFDRNSVTAQHIIHKQA